MSHKSKKKDTPTVVVRSNSSSGLTPVATTTTATTISASHGALPKGGGAFGFAGSLVDALTREKGEAAESGGRSSAASGLGASATTSTSENGALAEAAAQSAAAKKRRPPQHPNNQQNGIETSQRAQDRPQQSNSVHSVTQKVDFIGPSDAVKNLFALPLQNDVGVNIALHNIGNGTLLMDAAHDHIADAYADGGDGDDTAANYVEVEGGQEGAPRRGRRRRRPRSASGSNHAFKNMPDMSLSAQATSTPPALASARPGDNETMAIVSAVLQQQQHQQQPEIGEHLRQGNALLTDPQQQDGNKVANGRIAGNDRSDSRSALMVAPTRDITAATDEPELVAEASATQTYPTSEKQVQKPFRQDEIISQLLPPPERYAADAGVVAPNEPRQYLDWKFHEMHLVVASDAVICRPQCGVESHSGPADGPNSQAVAVRVADVNDLQSQMKLYQETKRLKAAGASENGAEVVSGKLLPLSNKQKQLYPSYAGALLSEGTKSEPVQQVVEPRGVADVTPSPLHTTRVPPTPIDSAIGNTGFISSPPPSSAADVSNPLPASSAAPTGASLPSSSPVITVLDAYLDNVMANVPQLALCLQEKGYIQSVKLLQTEDIPSSMMDATTFGFDDPLGEVAGRVDSSGEPVFSPQMVDMNATMLLRFLKANCSRENTTYLLRRGAGETNIQLYDISMLSSQRQKKWIWWLAMMSYRFALRLGQMSRTFVPKDDRAMKRDFRTRERSLLQNALELLEELDDMDGGKHETICAAIHEHLAGTLLFSDSTSDVDGAPGTSTSADPKGITQPLPTTSRLQPYENLARDALGKAEDHLSSGIKKIRPVLDRKRRAEKDRLASTRSRRKEKMSSSPKRSKGRIQSWYSSSSNSSSSSETDDEDESAPLPSSPEIEALSIQLYGLLHKKVNVSLRLAEHHLRDYRSSSAMQELRAAARNISDIVALLRPLGHLSAGIDDELPPSAFLQSTRYQYAWLWEYCGHFARSFASDDLWREEGHASGEDIVSLLQEVQAACCHLSLGGTKDNGQDSPLWIGSTKSEKDHAKTVLVTLKTQGIVSLRSPTPLVAAPSEIDRFGDRKERPSAVEIANSILREQTLLKRERRLVLVAASICYGRAAAAYLALRPAGTDGAMPPSPTVFVEEKTDDPLLHSTLSIDVASRDSSILMHLRKRLGDTCNEIGKLLLSEVKSILETPFANSDGNKDQLKATGPFLLSARFWFSESLRHFEASSDLRNIALLRCNLCQCCKIRANASVMLPKLDDESSEGSNSTTTHAEICLQQAADHLERAHERLGDRDADTRTWDMISTELAATLLVLGVRRRQTLLGRGTTPVIMQALRLNPGSERGIIEPIEQAIKIYETLGIGHQAAAANYQLALYYSKVWTCQRDENKTREKLSAAFKCFGAAHQYFYSAMRGNEPTFVILSLDFAGLFSSVSGQKESAEKALRCCIDTCDAFSSEAICAASQRQGMHSSLPDDKEWFDKMCALGDAIEDKVIKLLQELVKMEKSEGGDTYKNMYRAALTAKMAGKKAEGGGVMSKEAFASDPDTCSIPVYDLLKQLRAMKK